MNKSWQQTGYQLKCWWPIFENKYLENKYNTERFAINAVAIARGIFVLSLFFAFFLISDRFVEFLAPEVMLINMFIKLFVGIAGLICYMTITRNLKASVVHKTVNVFLGLFLTALFITFYIYSKWMAAPATLFELAICCSFLTILVYIFVPLNLVQQCVTALALILLYTLAAIFLFSTEDSRLGFATTFMFLSNTIGLSMSYTINKNFRIAWSVEQEKERDNQLLKTEIQQRKKLEEQLKRLAMTDALTGIDNRRSFMEHLSREKKRSDRQFTSLSIITFDIDLFKHINDQFGHEVGDKVLMDVASVIQDRLRETDIFGRIGGEEFAILMPDSTKKEALQLANSLRVALMQHAIVHEKKAIKVTASFGIAQYQTNEPVDILLRRADKAMYDAKSSGRNCVSDKSDD